MRFIAVPADADASVVLGTQNLGNFGARAAESFDAFDQRSAATRPIKSRSVAGEMNSSA
jgi:hypothetical protein